MEYELSNILRKLYSMYLAGDRIEAKLMNELKNILNRICYSRFGLSFNIDELVQQSIGNLFISFHSAVQKKDEVSVWNKCLSKSNDNDKILVTYFYLIINSSKNELTKDFFSNEGNRLYKVVSDICAELCLNDYLDIYGKDNYCKKNSYNKAPFNGDKILFLFSILNKNGTINNSSLTKLIRKLFDEYLENQYVSLSTLVQIISDITNVGNMTGISKDEEINDDGNPRLVLEHTNEDFHSRPDIIPEIDQAIERCWKRAEDYFEKDELELRAKIYILRYGCHYTIGETMDFLKTNLKKSSIDNYSKEFIKVIKLENEFTKDENYLKYMLDAFVLFLNAKYRVI